MNLYQHQKDAIALGRNHNVALFHDCGTGKTLTAIELIKHWKLKGEGPALVICPLSIIEAAWLVDIEKFASELDAVSLWDKKPAKRRKRLAEDHDIYIANYETFKGLWHEMQAKDFKVLIIDESSKMKNPTSQITRALLAMAGVQTRAKGGKKYGVCTIPHRYVLSGTPAPNDQSEYWAQIKFITGPGGKIFNDNFYAFRARYFYKQPIGRTGRNKWLFCRETQQELQEKIGTVAHVVAKEDAIDLPNQVHEIRDVILSPGERRAYDQLKSELVLQFASETVLASNALVEIMKLRQLSSGFIYGVEGTHVIGNSKMTELLSLLEQIGRHQVIIWANFRYEIQLLLDTLPRSAALWSKTEERSIVIKNFQDGYIQYLIANPLSAAHGLSFVNCNHAVYFSLNYSYELQKQSEDRIHRIGTTKKVTYFHLLAKNTIDRTIHRIVRRKGDLSKEILGYLRGAK